MMKLITRIDPGITSYKMELIYLPFNSKVYLLMHGIF